ncbi:hypothetical protein ACKWTF_011596 [Chironomus riparius]
MNDSGFNSGAEMNIDNIFFYEDNSTHSSQDNMPIAFNNNNNNVNINSNNNNEDDQAISMDTNDQGDSSLFVNAVNIPKQKRIKDSKLTQIQVSVGIDEDLKMILDLDPTLIDGVDLEKAVEPAVHNDARLTSLPPKIPTFKTITPTSRTQLKTLLQREQLLQEAERKETERKLLERERDHHKQKQESQKVPLQVDVPPQILQVRTQLSNPTKYHVIQKQKNQVREYLSESFKSSDTLHNLIPYPVLQHNNINGNSLIASKSQPATTCNSPGVKPNVNSKLLNHVKNNNLLSHSANEMLHVQSLDYSSGQSASNNSFPFVLQQHRYIAAASPQSAMSPSISSVATSVTSASEADDYIDEILNYDSIPDAIKYEINSVTDAKIKQEPHLSVSETDKDRQKKDNHNMSK